MATSRLVYKVPGMDKVNVRSDIVYRRAGNDELKMDVYRPAGTPASAKLPAVIFIHGGPLTRGLPLPPKDWGVYVSYGRLAAASGFAGVTFNHRFFELSDVQTAQDDIDALVAYVRDQAPALGIDADRLAAWTFSGGGVFFGPWIRRPPAFIRSLVAFYALMDLRSLKPPAPAEMSDDVLKKFSPVAAVEETQDAVPPVFIGRAGLDNPGLNASIDKFAAAALKKNVLLTLCNHPQGCHGFDIRNDDDQSRTIIRQAVEFLKSHV